MSTRPPQEGEVSKIMQDKIDAVFEKIENILPTYSMMSAVPRDPDSYASTPSSGTGVEVILEPDKMVDTGNIDLKDFKEALSNYCKNKDVIIKINQIIKLKKGIKLYLVNDTDRENLFAFIRESKYKDNFNFYQPKKLWPKILIRETHLENKDELIVKLKLNNALFNDPTDFKILFNIKAKFRGVNVTHWVLEVRPDKYNKMLNLKQVYIDIYKCHIEKFSSVRFCRKCLLYGHTRKWCRSKDDLCYRCGKAKHDQDEDCDLKCFNCNSINIKYDNSLETQHPAGSRNCKMFIKEEKKMDERTSFG